MAQPNRKHGQTAQAVAEKVEELTALRSRAVAIDPPPNGAIGIKELLDRFERFAATDELVDPPENGAVGVRELLARLNKLADAGYFGPADTDEGRKRQA